MILNLFADPPVQTIDGSWFLSLFSDIWRWIFKFLSNTYFNFGNGMRFSFLTIFIAIFVFGIVTSVVINVVKSVVSINPPERPAQKSVEKSDSILDEFLPLTYSPGNSNTKYFPVNHMKKKD